VFGRGVTRSLLAGIQVFTTSRSPSCISSSLSNFIKVRPCRSSIWGIIIDRDSTMYKGQVAEVFRNSLKLQCCTVLPRPTPKWSTSTGVLFINDNDVAMQIFLFEPSQSLFLQVSLISEYLNQWQPTLIYPFCKASLDHPTSP
jgi:hypothetical protein